MPVTNRFPLWGREGEIPDDGFEYEGGDQVNEKHLNYLWDSSQKQAADFIAKTNDLQENKLQRDGSQAMTGELSVQGVSTQGTRTFFRDTETRMTFHLDRTRLRSQNVTIEQDLAKEGGPTIWDSTAEHIPQGRLQNDSLSVNTGTGLSNGGSIALGGSRQLSLDTTYTDDRYVQVNGDTMTGNLSLSNNRITNLSFPSASTDAANRQYVDDNALSQEEVKPIALAYDFIGV